MFPPLPEDSGRKDQALQVPLTKETLVAYQEEQLIKYAVRVVPRMFRSILKGMKEGNTKAIEQAAQIYGFVKSSPGITFNLQNNTYNEASATGIYFEGVVRRLEERDRPTGDDGIIDAEVVEE